MFIQFSAGSADNICKLSMNTVSLICSLALPTGQLYNNLTLNIKLLHEKKKTLGQGFLDANINLTRITCETF